MNYTAPKILCLIMLSAQLLGCGRIEVEKVHDRVALIFTNNTAKEQAQLTIVRVRKQYPGLSTAAVDWSTSRSDVYIYPVTNVTAFSDAINIRLSPWKDRNEFLVTEILGEAKAIP